jgi:hypothetical protein
MLIPQQKPLERLMNQITGVRSAGYAVYARLFKLATKIMESKSLPR